MGTGGLRRWTVLMAVAGLSCRSSTDSPPPSCVDSGPTFRLTVGTEAGLPLPPGTRLDVRYGGGTSTFIVGQAPPTSQVLFCQSGEPGAADVAGVAGAGSAGAGAAGAGTAGASSDAGRLSCELWTRGSASVAVTAPGYDPLEEELALSLDDDDCVTASDVDVSLVEPVVDDDP